MSLTPPPSGEISLPTLLSTLTLKIHPSTFVFLTFPSGGAEGGPPATLFQQMSFREVEGLTIISTLESAQEHNLPCRFPCKMITCEVHSSLEAVGFMAALTGVLAGKGVGVNVVSGFYHDYIFVGEGREGEAVAALEEMVREAMGKR